MRTAILGLALLGLAGCMKVSDMAEATRYHLSDAGILDHSSMQRSANWRLQPDSAIFIAQSHFVPPGSAYPRPNVVAEEALMAFAEYFPRVRRAPAAVGLDEAMQAARASGSHYLLYTRFAAADNRVGTYDEWDEEWAVDRLGVDTGVIQLMLVEVSTGYQLDAARIKGRGGLLEIFDAQPADLLRPPFREYAQMLLGLPR